MGALVEAGRFLLACAFVAAYYATICLLAGFALVVVLVPIYVAYRVLL